MVKVRTELGLTLKLFKESQFEFIRPSVSLEIEVEKEEDIKPQLELAIKALRSEWEKTTEEMNSLVLSQMPQINAESEVQIAKRFKEIEKSIEEIKKRIGK